MILQKLSPVLMFLVFSFFSISLSSQESLNKAADTACECIEKNLGEDSKKNDEKIQQCIQEAFMTHYAEISKDFKMDPTDQKAMEEIGIKLGKILIKRCEKFMDYSIQVAESQQEETITPTKTINETEGKLTRIDKKEFVHFILSESNGRELDFLWLRYFQDSEKYKGENADKYIGKQMKIKWQELECYLPKAGNYYNVKEIIGIDVMD
ncbi:MAG: hypothetical protein GY705_18065 [Bacteroidetes bacterium]|nr:hypothetical protein [Bacteroidota bacterium]